jgi:hypothetical protein
VLRSVSSVILRVRDAALSGPKDQTGFASATWLFRGVLAHSVSHDGRSLMASRRLQHRSHSRQWQHGNRPAVEHHRLNAIQARRGHDDAAIGADSLDPNQDLELNAFHHSKDPAPGTHVTTIPGCLIHHDGVLKPVNQFSGGYLIGEDVDISGVYWQPMQGERSTPAHGPLAVPDSGEPLKRPAPCRNRAIHAASIGSAPYGGPTVKSALVLGDYAVTTRTYVLGLERSSSCRITAGTMP